MKIKKNIKSYIVAKNVNHNGKKLVVIKFYGYLDIIQMLMKILFFSFYV